MAQRIQQRRDSAATWTAVNPILAAGEVGYETDTGLEKTGDGATAWNALAHKVTTPASEAEALAGTNNTKAMTPLRAATTIDRLAVIADSSRFTDLQDAIDLADANGGGRVHVHQTWTLTEPLVLPSNVHLDLGRTGVIRRGWNSVVPVPQLNKYTGALIRQESTSSALPTTNVTISGGRIEANGFEGPTIAMYHVENLTLSDIDIDYTDAGDWAVTVAGVGINISNVNPRGGVDIFEDGIHVVAIGTTEYVNITGCHVESGDDMVALTTFTDTANTIRHVTINGVTGSSQRGHLFRIDIAAAGGAVEHITFNGGTAHSGVVRNGGIYLLNASGDRQKMRHIAVDGVTLRTGNTATVNPRGVYIDCGYDITLTNVHANGFLWENLYLDDVDLLTVANSSFFGAASSTFPTARILSSGTVVLNGCTIAIGSAGTTSPIRHHTVERLVLRNCGLLGVPLNGHGIYVDAGNTTLDVAGCWSTTAAATAHGVRVIGALTRLIYGSNDFALGTAGHDIYPANLPTTMQIAPTSGTPATATIVTGILTVPTVKGRLRVAGEGAAADDLVTMRLISGLNGYDGQAVVLMRGSQDITVKHGTGNIVTRTGADVTLTVMQLIYNGTNWVQV